MPFGLLRYGLRRGYPVRGDIPLTPPLRSSYDVVIVGGGGHGLAAAHYLAKYHGITNVAVLERGYLAGGNTARNTTAIRSNYITQESVRFYKEAVSLYEGLSQELGFNVMFSQRGQLTLAHNEATVRTFHQRAEMGKLMGTRLEVIEPKTVLEICPHINLDIGGRYEVLAGLWHADGGTARHDAVAWGFAAEAAKRGVEIHQHTEVVGYGIEHGCVEQVHTNRGTIRAGQVLQAVAGMNYKVARLAGIELPIAPILCRRW
jgi:sarcosine oxidase subunit beta